MTVSVPFLAVLAATSPALLIFWDVGARPNTNEKTNVSISTLVEPRDLDR